MMRESAANTEPNYYCIAQLSMVIAQDKMVIRSHFVTPERSEGSLLMGREMLRCADPSLPLRCAQSFGSG